MLQPDSLSYESLVIFLPVHNEEASLFRVGQDTIHALASLSIPAALLIVNDGSTDRTAAEIELLQQAYPSRVDVVTHKENRGYGAALRTGLKRGLEKDADLVGIMDGDGQFDPNDIQSLVHKISSDKTDAVIGIRENRSDNLHRVWLGNGWKRVSNSVLDCEVTDVDCGLKVFRSEPLARILPKLISVTGAAISPEIVARLRANNATFSEVEVSHRPRLEGKSSGGKPSVALKSLVDLMKVRRDLTKTT